jgi:AcrR family transcriptional regulator
LPQTRSIRATQTRERILDAADRLLNAQGIRQTGVDAISAEAGLTKVTLYKHFDSKEQLVAEVLGRREEKWREWFETSVCERASSATDQILAIFDVLEEWFQTEDFRGSIFINASVETRASNHPYHAVVLEHMRKNRDFVRKLAISANLPDPEQVEWHVITLIRGSIVSALMENDASVARHARIAVEKVLKKS